MNRRRPHKEDMNAIRKSYYESPGVEAVAGCWFLT